MLNKLPERLQLLRERHGLLQKDLAHILGVSVRMYQRYEAGTHEPDMDGLLLLAGRFGVSTDYLLGKADE